MNDILYKIFDGDEVDEMRREWVLSNTLFFVFLIIGVACDVYSHFNCNNCIQAVGLVSLFVMSTIPLYWLMDGKR